MEFSSFLRLLCLDPLWPVLVDRFDSLSINVIQPPSRAMAQGTN